MNFKRIILSAMLTALLVMGGQFIFVNTAAAQEVLFEIDSSFNIYVDTDTISGDQTHAKAVVKYLRRGAASRRPVKTEVWQFSKASLTDNWQYKATDASLKQVISHSFSHRLLEKCADKLGLSLKIKGEYVY